MPTKKDNNKLDPIIALAKNIDQLTKQAVGIYYVEVENIIESKTKNQKTIERCLDGMLDFCSDKKMLELFKRLCRYYLPINERAVIEYVNIYRELWDSEEKEIKIT
jgi:CCR4-NOT transcriptional regulation complex NOT5 subunit